jgi:hypothetical protein
MTVDMHEGKFRKLLNELPAFERPGSFDVRVRQIDFPAWRAIFSSLLLKGHSTGYRLPSANQFCDTCVLWYTDKHQPKDFTKWFTDPWAEQTRNRLLGWYESGMAETYMYVCLIDIFEDLLRDGIVLYDPRADWKLKADAVVIRDTQCFRVSCFTGTADNRGRIETKREADERERKKNTIQSSHLGNTLLPNLQEIRLAVTDSDHQVVNGLRLMSITAFNEQVLTPIYDACGTPACDRRTMPVAAKERDALYKGFLGR